MNTLKRLSLGLLLSSVLFGVFGCAPFKRYESIGSGGVRYDLERAEALPCPFCGGHAEVLDASSPANGAWSVQCQSGYCKIEPWTGWRETRKEALNAWNTRPK